MRGRTPTVVAGGLIAVLAVVLATRPGPLGLWRRMWRRLTTARALSGLAARRTRLRAALARPPAAGGLRPALVAEYADDDGRVRWERVDVQAEAAGASSQASPAFFFFSRFHRVWVPAGRRVVAGESCLFLVSSRLGPSGPTTCRRRQVLFISRFIAPGSQRTEDACGAILRDGRRRCRCCSRTLRPRRRPPRRARW